MRFHRIRVEREKILRLEKYNLLFKYYISIRLNLKIMGR